MGGLGLYLVGAVLLAVAGAAKAARPGDTARAVSGALGGAPRAWRHAVRGLAAVEAAIGVVAVCFPERWAAVAVAASYAAFAGWVLWARRSGSALATCGCFGTPDTPPTLLHAGLDTVIACGAVAVAFAGPGGGLLAVLSHQYASGVPLAAASALGAWLAYLVMSPLARLGALHAPRAPRTRRPAVTLTTRLSGVLDRRLSRRSFVVRSAFVGSAIAAGGTDYVLSPGSAYGSICTCGSSSCGCGTTCSAGYTEFCCVLDGGYNYCPSDTVMGGWWRAEGSAYCSGPRYYMDCNARCSCTSGCGNGYQFCEPGCDHLTCGCAGGSCDHYLTGCFQFRYGQCNQEERCIGRIKCRVVTCVPPWEIDSSCTRTNAEDDGTANQNAACLTPGPNPPPPPKPVCPSESLTRCEVVALASSVSARGYGMATSYGRFIAFGDEADRGGVDYHLTDPVVALTGCHTGGYWMTNTKGRVFQYGEAKWHGSATHDHVDSPIVAMAATPTGDGYWLLSQKGRVMAFGDAVYKGEASKGYYPSGFVGIAPTPSGQGYWLTTAAGRVFGYGDARFHGSTVDRKLPAPIVGMASTPFGSGYWLVGGDGSVYNYGSAGYHGGTHGRHLQYPIVGMSRTASGKGYWLVSKEGRVFNFGSAGFYGSAVNGNHH